MSLLLFCVLLWFRPSFPFARPAQQSGTGTTRASALATSQQRLEIARKLSAILHSQDLEITAVAAGQDNDTIVFTSEMFATPDGRLQFIQLYRRNFETLHCQLGFRKVVLAKGTFSLGSNEYELHCPQTPAERAAALQLRSKAVAGLESDFRREGLAITAQLQGPNQDRLTLSSDLFQIKADRDNFAKKIKETIELELCGQGLKTIRLQNAGQGSQFRDYLLNCG